MNDQFVSKKVYEEKKAPAANGFAMLGITLLIILAAIAATIIGGILVSNMKNVPGGILIAAEIIVCCLAPILFAGLKVIGPNEALVLTLFGNYYGTLKSEGFYWVNPFCTGVNPTVTGSGFSMASTGKVSMGTNGSGASKKVSLKAMTLDNNKQKVNDELGNPIESAQSLSGRLWILSKPYLMYRIAQNLPVHSVRLYCPQCCQTVPL